MSYTRNEVILSVQDVGLNFGTHVVLKNVNAEIRNVVRPGMTQGQVICFLGPSGVGKTRLARLIAGLDKPTSGRILGAEGKELDPGSVGMVPQKYPLFEFLTAEGNLDVAVAHAADPKRAREDKKHFIELLGLGPFLSRYPGQLSGGTCQRVAIARQFLCSEHVVILDEPFSGLDFKMRKKTCELIVKIAEMHELNTVIVITHDVVEGLSVADTTWLMGVDKGADDKAIPGARIIEEYDLAALGLAWQPDLVDSPAFSEVVKAVKAKFLEVSP